METKSNNISLKAILIVIGAGIWIIVLQNAGIIPKLVGTDSGSQNVFVTGGNLEADVNGRVSVDNTVDINIESVNGHRNAFYGPSVSGNYDALHVYTGK